jgi:hypothetical protein
LSTGEDSIETVPAPLKASNQAQLGERGDQSRHEKRIELFKQSISPPTKETAYWARARNVQREGFPPNLERWIVLLCQV